MIHLLLALILAYDHIKLVTIPPRLFRGASVIKDQSVRSAAMKFAIISGFLLLCRVGVSRAMKRSSAELTPQLPSPVCQRNTYLCGKHLPASIVIASPNITLLAA